MYKRIISVLLMIIIVCSATPIAVSASSNYSQSIIDAVLANEAVWRDDTIWNSDGYYGPNYLQFLDLNFDGNLEFVVTYTGGTMRNISSQVFYFSDGRLVRAGGGDLSDLISSYSATTLSYYYNQKSKSYIIDCQNAPSESSTKASVQKYLLVFDGKDITVDYYSAKIPAYTMSNNSATVKYYDGASAWGNVEGANEISEEKYNKINISVLSDCVNANMVSDVVRSTDWKGKSTSQKRSLLENAYNSFSYDKYNFDQGSNGIHIYSDRTSMSTQVGDNITIGVDVYENNKPTSDCSGVSLSIENSSVYTLKNTEIKNNRRYFILKSKSAGNTSITISDSKTGYIKRFYLYSFNNDTCSYTIRNIPRYKIGNYTCNLNQGNSVFVDDFNVVSYNDSTGIANITLTVYNSLGVYGAVEIYDKDAKLQDVAIIKKFKSASTSIKECLWDKTLCLVDDVANDNLFSYHSSVSYKETKITATIPKDGYIRITTDAEGSVPVSLINMFDMLMAGKSIAGELSGFDSKEDIFAEKLSYNMVVNKIYEKLLQSDSKFASKLVKKVGKDVLYSTNATGDYLNSVLNNLQDVDMMKTVKETAWEMGWSIGEDIFEYFSGPIGLMMKGLFTFSKIGNLAVQINDFIRYQGTEYASVSNPASGAMYSSEVIVISDNEEKNAAIRSYRIEIKDELFPELIEMLERRNQKVYRGDKSFFYEIKYIKDGVLSEPDSSVEVNIPIPEGMVPLIATKKVKLYRINDDNSIEEMTYTYKNGYLSFKTDHFSYYSIVTEKTSSGIVGDADYDSIVTVMDASLIQYYLANMAEEYDLDIICSDVNDDKEVGIVDATYIQRYIAGIINGFSLPESVSLNYSSKQMNVGDSITLKGSIIPSQVMYNDLTWESSNKSVATVNNGVVTAKAAGTATISATTHNGKTAKCNITVVPAPNSVTLNSSSISLDVGGTYQLSATVSPSDANDKTVSWNTSNSAVATVDSTGKITAKSSGSATITATTSNGKKASCTVYVNSIEISSVSLNAYSITLDEQQTYQLSATVYPSNATNKTLTWSTNNSSVATVSSTGKVTAVSGGTANITAKTTNGKSVSCTVTVNEKIMPKSIEVLPEVLTLTVGNTFELNAKITPNNAVDKSVSWSSSNSNAVSVDQNGKLVANKAGMSATITARTVNGLTSTVKVDTVEKASQYGSFWGLGVKYDDKIYSAPVSKGPLYVSSSGDDLYFISEIDSEIYIGATLKLYITSGSSGVYDTKSIPVSYSTYDVSAHKGYIPISQYLNTHKGQYIRVYTELVLAKGQVVKPANLGTDDAIYLYMNE